MSCNFIGAHILVVIFKEFPYHVSCRISMYPFLTKNMDVFLRHFPIWQGCFIYINVRYEKQEAEYVLWISKVGNDKQ